MTTREFEMTRRLVAGQLALIKREIEKLQDPADRAYFLPLYNDARRHLDDIQLQLIKEGKIRLWA